jgi:hypothetical protein
MQKSQPIPTSVVGDSDKPQKAAVEGATSSAFSLRSAEPKSCRLPSYSSLPNFSIQKAKLSEHQVMRNYFTRKSLSQPTLEVGITKKVGKKENTIKVGHVFACVSFKTPNDDCKPPFMSDIKTRGKNMVPPSPVKFQIRRRSLATLSEPNSCRLEHRPDRKAGATVFQEMMNSTQLLLGAGSPVTHFLDSAHSSSTYLLSDTVSFQDHFDTISVDPSPSMSSLQVGPQTDYTHYSQQTNTSSSYILSDNYTDSTEISSTNLLASSSGLQKHPLQATSAQTFQGR